MAPDPRLVPQPTDPPWLTRAWQDLGKDEVRDGAWVLSLTSRFARWVQGYYRSATGQPWCALGLSSWLVDCGIRAPENPLSAGAYATWGSDVSGEPHERGDIIVLSRLGGHHVGMWLAEEAAGEHGLMGRVALLGANQANAVSVQWFDTRRIRARRWPQTFIGARPRG